MSAPPTPHWAWGVPARIERWSRAGGTTLGLRSTLWPQQQVPSSRYLLWQRLCHTVAAWRGDQDQPSGAGSICETRQEEAGSGRQGSKDEAVTLCCQDAMVDALAQ